MQLITKQFQSSKKLTDNFEFVITNEVIDRAFDRISVDGVDYSNYMNNPVVFFNHESRSLPIAKATNISVRSIGGIKSLVAAIEFDTEDELANIIKSKLERGFLNAVSVGIRILDSEIVPLSDTESKEYNINSINLIKKSELYEFSIVTIPMNQTALSIKSLFNKSELELIEKAGRVLSQANYEKLTDAHSAIGEVLASSQTETTASAKAKIINQYEKEMTGTKGDAESPFTAKAFEPLQTKIQELEAKVETAEKIYRDKSVVEIDDRGINPEETFKAKMLGVASMIKHSGDKDTVRKSLAGNSLAIKQLDTLTNQTGGYLISDDYSPNILPYIYPDSFLNKVSVTKVPMTKESIKIPLAGVIDDFDFVGKYDAGTEVDLTFGEIELRVKRMKALMVIGNDLLEQSEYNIAQFIQTQLTEKASTILDSKALMSDGSENQILGLYYQMASANKFNSAGTSLANVESDIQKAVRLVEENLQKITSGAFLMSSRTVEGNQHI